MAYAPFSKPAAWTDIPTMSEGAGWGGATAEPSRTGASTDAFYGARAIARWTSVPMRNVYSDTEDIVFGVLAFHGDTRGYAGCWVQKVEMALDGGSWVTATWGLNPQTGTFEYRAKIDCSAVTAGVHEVRARIYPFSGYCRVLSDMTFRRWADGTTRSVAYVNPTTGNDGTGTLNSTSNKYATIHAAGVALEAADATNKADGCTIYLDAGDHKWYRAATGQTINNVASFVEITRSPGTAIGDVNIVDRAGTGFDYVNVERVRVYGVTIKTTLQTSAGGLTDYLWMDQVACSGLGYDQNEQSYCQASSWTKVWFTDSTYADIESGPGAVELARGVHTYRTGHDIFSGAGCVSHCTVTDGMVAGSNHVDFYQNVTVTDNVVIYRNDLSDDWPAQFFFVDPAAGVNFSNFAVVDNYVNNSAYPDQSQVNCQFDHLVWWHNTHIGTPLTVSWSDAGEATLFSSTNFSMYRNVFQWLALQDPDSMVGHTPLTNADAEAFGTWDQNHHINTLSGGGALSASSYWTPGTNTSTGASVPYAKGCTWRR